MTPDAVVVGSGPNGLAAAVVLASHGLRVQVLEEADEPGGGARTEELTLPGFRHDSCSAIHPMGAGSPLFRALPLDRHGLEWIHPPVCVAHPLDDHPAAWIERSVDRVADALDEDGSAYRRLFGPCVDRWDETVGALLGPPLTPRGMAGLAAWSLGLLPADRLARGAFTGERARALLAGLAAHSILPLERHASAGVGLVLGAAAHAVGWPLPRGGAGAIGGALRALLEEMGGEVVTGCRVRALLDVPPARAILLDLTPGPALEVLEGAVPSGYERSLARFPYGPGAFKLDWALREPIPWRDDACRAAGTVHVGGSLDEVADAERAAWTGRACDRPFVLVAQPSRFDPTRAPAGRHTAWAYCHVPHGSAADWTARIEAQVERFAPGFRDCIEARAAMSPETFEERNPNLVGGDIGAGALTLRRILAGPVVRRDPYSTPRPEVFLCSGSTPPGAGVHGMCGFHAGRSALRRRFGIEVPADPARALGPRLRRPVP